MRFVSVVWVFLLAGCQGTEPERATAAATSAAAPTGWTCPAEPGSAPSGELRAQRISSADSTREAAGLYEGPVWLGDSLYFSDFTFESGFPSRIRQLNPDGSVTTVIPNSGSNGLTIGGDHSLLAATHDRKAISRYHLPEGNLPESSSPNAEREIVVDQYRNNPFNSPNDLVVTRDGVIYFTDPGFQRSAAPGGQPKTQVFRVENKAISVVDASIDNPNGIALSPQEDWLYVSGGGENGLLKVYALQNGEPGPGSELASLTVPDGLAVDCLGNIYATEHTEQRIRVFTPTGRPIATIQLDDNVTNATFGGNDRRTLFITGAGALWKLELDVAGLPH